MPRALAWTLIGGFGDAAVAMATQRVMWETQAMIRHVASKTASANEVGLDNARLLNDLKLWRCHESQSVLQCLEDLLPDQQKYLVTMWSRILPHSLHPSRIAITDKLFNTQKQGIQVVFNPARPLRDDYFSPPSIFRSNCSESDSALYTPVVPKSYPITDITLVVVMNFADLVRNIPLLEFLHARAFRHIIYCAVSMDVYIEWYHSTPSVQTTPVSFIEAEVDYHNRGDQGFVCAMEVLKMGYKTRGVFQLADDALLNTWNVNALPRDRPWYHFRHFKMSLVEGNPQSHCFTCGRWGAWPYFAKNITGAWNAMHRYANMQGSAPEKIEAQSFLEQLRQNTGFEEWVVYGGSDVFYISHEYSERFLFATTVFHNYKVNLEFATPTLIYGIAPHRLIVEMAGKYLWFGDRDHIPNFYSHLDIFMHAYKASLLQDTEQVRWFCKHHILNLDGWLKKH